MPMQPRSIQLAGAINLRDFGGYATAAGHQVRYGRLYRSGLLSRLTPEAQAAFHDLGVETICDLRRADEKEEDPTPFSAGAPRRVNIPIDPGSATAMRAALSQAEVPLQARIDFMVEINRELAREHTEDYARMFEALLEIEEGAFLLHCSAGKDRTGFGCALILHALGVPEQTVRDDYLLTNQSIDFEAFILPRLREHYGQEKLPDMEAVHALAGVREEYLRAAFEEIEREFEGVERYLQSMIRLDETARARLRARLVE